MMFVADVWEEDRGFVELWSLAFEDLALLSAKPSGARLGFAAQLMLYRATSRFGLAASDFPDAAITYLAEQIGAAPADIADFNWTGRSGRRYRAEILDYLGACAAHPSKTCRMRTLGSKPICVRLGCLRQK